MALAKLEIQEESGPDQFDKKITVLFNPNLITVQKNVNWRLAATAGRDVPESQFTYGDPATLSMELFFDTYEKGDAHAQGSDVRKQTRDVFHLTTVAKHGNIHRPPICRLAWGKAGVFFQGILTGLTQRFTLFLADGTPVRAILGCTFQEWRSGQDDALLQNKQSADVTKTRTVKLGETLSAIAAEEYNDPGLWRPIAEVNGIDDPRVLAPGKVLALPALAPPRSLRS